MRERGLRAIANLCKLADDKADAVLLNIYFFSSLFRMI